MSEGSSSGDDGVHVVEGLITPDDAGEEHDDDGGEGASAFHGVFLAV